MIYSRRMLLTIKPFHDIIIAYVKYVMIVFLRGSQKESFLYEKNEKIEPLQKITGADTISIIMAVIYGM